ncbi:probable cysteine protease RD19B [Nymphaea colorata]|nr:probable cysteine protease RD19B [Nymphaea colorata]
MEPTGLPKLSCPLFSHFLAVLLFPSILAATDNLAGNPIRLVTDSGRPSLTHVLLNAEEHFHEFLKRFNKKYSGQEEHKRRFSIFKSNLLKAMHHQALNPTAIHGITKFSDLTEEEFSSMYLGLHQIPRDFSRLEPAPFLRTDDLPESFDWRERGAVTPVKDQGSCGSCWSFSTTGALEGAHFLKTGQLLNLSQQQLVDCDHECQPLGEGLTCNSGCFGGLMTNAFRYAIKVGGLQREEDYPYRGIEGACKFDKSKVAAKMANFSIVSTDEDQIAAHLVKHGPLSVAINSKFMQSYVGGVSCPLICSKRLNHGVLLVGYGSGEYAKERLRKLPFWLIKNSWGADWGEDGYYKVCREHNMCGVNDMVSSVIAATP